MFTKISFYCTALKVSRQGFYAYLKNNDNPWKYEELADAMIEIIKEDECNDTYGRIRMNQALMLKHGENMDIPSERTVYRVMERIGISHSKKHKPNGITKSDREARKSEDKLQRDFSADEPNVKAVTDITELKASDGKLYTSVIFDCFDLTALGISIGDNMKAELCVSTIENAILLHPEIKGMILHSDRGSHYTSDAYRTALMRNDLIQSMIVTVEDAMIMHAVKACGQK